MRTETKPHAGDPDTRRPRTLKEAANWGAIYGESDAFVREFLDEFYLEQSGEARQVMLSDEPDLSGEPKHDAYLAAIAEHLSFQYKLPVPDWALQPTRFLKRPYFPYELESLKATVLVESPTAFRRRMIFVDADPLYRPRRDTPVFRFPWGATP